MCFPTTPRTDEMARDPANRAAVKAIARAWDWRRRLETGEAATLRDLADAESVTLPFVSRLIRLAYLSPAVIDRIIANGEPVAVSLERLAATALKPWRGQRQIALDERCPISAKSEDDGVSAQR